MPVPFNIKKKKKKAVGNEEKREPLYAAGGHGNYSSHQEITTEVPQKNKTKQATFIISLAGDLAIVFFGIYQKISRFDHRQT